jgi:hypothetical protein
VVQVSCVLGFIGLQVSLFMGASVGVRSRRFVCAGCSARRMRVTSESCLFVRGVKRLVFAVECAAQCLVSGSGVEAVVVFGVQRKEDAWCCQVQG